MLQELRSKRYIVRKEILSIQIDKLVDKYMIKG